MFKKLLCPTDFSENSGKALHWTEYLANKFQSEVVIAHVLPFPETNLVADANFEVYQATGITSLRKFVADLKIKHQTLLSAGEPWQKIVELSEKLNASGIVMGTRGEKGVSHKFFGSTTENVIRESTAPVMTITPSCTTPPTIEKKNVLLPVSSLDAFFPGPVRFRRILREMCSSVTILHVIDFNDAMFQSHFHVRPFQVVDFETQKGEQRLAQLGKRLSGAFTAVPVNPLIRFGDAAEEILREVKTHRYDLVLMGVKKRTLISRFLESVAYKVISESEVPVISVRTTS